MKLEYEDDNHQHCDPMDERVMHDRDGELEYVELLTHELFTSLQAAMCGSSRRGLTRQVAFER